MSDAPTAIEINKAFGNANFGPDQNEVRIVQLGLLKCACGFYQGWTSTKILEELGLITAEYELTARGSRSLWKWLGEETF